MEGVTVSRVDHHLSRLPQPRPSPGPAKQQSALISPKLRLPRSKLIFCPLHFILNFSTFAGLFYILLSKCVKSSVQVFDYQYIELKVQ